MHKWFAICFLVFALTTGCQKKEQEFKRPPPRVKIAKAYQGRVPIFIEAVGHLTAYNSAEIRAQVEGELKQLLFEQGQDVEKDQLLFVIDPRPFEAALQETIANLEKSKADLKLAQDKVERNVTLVEKDYISQLQFDELLTEVATTQAAVKMNDAEVQKAQIKLDYCFIKSPFEGRIGKKLIDEGNLIVNDGKKMLIVNQISPMYIDFSIPERDLVSVQQHQTQEGLTLEIEIPNVKKIKEKGHLIVINNEVEEGTGMVALRGVIQNQDKTLWPGQFIKVRLIVEEKQDAIVVPDAAVNIGQKGSYILTVNDQGIAEMKLVKVGERVGKHVIIKKGIEAGEQVIIDGQINVRPGKEVEIIK